MIGQFSLISMIWTNHRTLTSLIHRLSQVCVKFRVFASNDETWRIRISRRWPGQYPAVALTANQRPGIDASTNQKPVLDIPTNKMTAGEDEVDNSTNRKPGVNQTPGVEILANQSSGMEASTNRKPGVFSWTEACIAREEECALWGTQESSGALSMRATVCSNAHYSSVDCVRVIRAGELVVSGSRDR